MTDNGLKALLIRPCRRRQDLRSAHFYADAMELEFRGPVVYWRGPAPFYFVPVPEAECAQLQAASALVSYGWGVIPVTARIGATTWTTSLFPKDGGYLVPVKADVRRAEGLDEENVVEVRLAVGV